MKFSTCIPPWIKIVLVTLYPLFRGECWFVGCCWWIKIFLKRFGLKKMSFQNALSILHKSTTRPLLHCSSSALENKTNSNGPVPSKRMDSFCANYCTVYFQMLVAFCRIFFRWNAPLRTTYALDFRRPKIKCVGRRFISKTWITFWNTLYIKYITFLGTVNDNGSHLLGCNLKNLKNHK